MDLNIENYSLVELMVVLDLSETPDKEETIKKSQEMIDKFTEENKLILADFFTKARDKVIEYLDSMEDIDESYRLILDQNFPYDCDDEQSTILYKNMEPLIKSTNCKMNVNSQYRNTMTRMLIINSEYLKKQNECDFSFDLSEPITDVLSISLYSFQIPYTWYNIDSLYGTNKFYVTNNDTLSGIELDHGQYDNETLVSTVESKLSDLITTATCSFNKVNGKVTFTFPKSVSEVCFFKEDDNTKINYNLGYILGFRKVIYERNNVIDDVWSITSEAVCNSSGSRNLQIMLDDFNKNRLNTNLINMYNNADPNLKTPVYFNYTIERNQNAEVVETTPRTLTQNQIYAMNQIESDRSKNAGFTKTNTVNTSDMFATLSINRDKKNIGEMCSQQEESLQKNKREYFGSTTLSRMHIKLLDDRGNILSLNGNDWSFTIICETLYQGSQKEKSE